MTDEHVIEAVESLVGVGSGAWDTVNPMDLLDAFRAVLSQGKQQAEGFTPDPDEPGMGTWWCPHCGHGQPANWKRALSTPPTSSEKENE